MGQEGQNLSWEGTRALLRYNHSSKLQGELHGRGFVYCVSLLDGASGQWPSRVPGGELA